MKYKFMGLIKDRTVAGTIRWRVRVEGDRKKRIKIPVGPGHPTFDEHYAAGREGRAIEYNVE